LRRQEFRLPTAEPNVAPVVASAHTAVNRVLWRKRARFVIVEAAYWALKMVAFDGRNCITRHLRFPDKTWRG
jgi:hypothetical protein